MEVLLGGITSVFYGVSDFLGGEASRKAHPASVVFWVGVISVPVLALVALILGGNADTTDYLLGLGAGTVGTLGLVMLFAGLSRGRAAAVAPVAAAVGAVLPVVVGVLIGERPSALAWTGVALAIPGVALSAWVRGEPRSASGLVYGLAAGLGFGGSAAFLGLTGDDSGLLPLIPMRAALPVVVLLVALGGMWRVSRFGEIPRGLVVANSLLDVTANITLVFALRVGSLALGAVAASCYPAVTVLLARTVNKETLLASQVGGIGLTLVALGLIAAG